MADPLLRDADYETLGIKPGATPFEVWEAYQNLAVVWHPERFGGDRYLDGLARRQLAEIRAAYQRITAVLGSPASSQADPVATALRWRHHPRRIVRMALWWTVLVAGIYVATR